MKMAVNNEIEKALVRVYERAKILIGSPSDHARLVAMAKLKDACLAVERAERRRERTLRALAKMEEA